MINVTCQTCGKNFKLRDELAGREGKCSCGSILVIPSLTRVVVGSSTDSREQLLGIRTPTKVERQSSFGSDRGARFPQKTTDLHVEADERGKASLRAGDPSTLTKPRKRKRIAVIATVVGLIVAAVCAQIVFVVIPDHRKMQETLHDAVKQLDKVDAMREKAVKQQQAQNDAELATVMAQQKGSIEGEVWLEKRSGETLSISSESVYLFPVDIKTDGPSGNFHFGLEAIQLPIKVAADLPGNESAAAAAEDATKNLEALKPYINSPTAPSITVISGSIAVCGTRASANRTSKLLGRDNSAAVETTIENETFWKLMQDQKVYVAETGRNGKFILDCEPGTYVIGCRCFKPALGAVVYWGQKVEVKPGKSTRLDLTPSNAIVVSY